jgi:hypothetical protein
VITLATSRYAARDLIRASGLAPVAISRSVPRWPLGYAIAGHLVELAPPWAIMKLERERFEIAYQRQLERLDFDELARRFEEMAEVAGSVGCVALCFEDLSKPDAWCHRSTLGEIWSVRRPETVFELSPN